MTPKSHNSKRHSVYYFEPFQFHSSQFHGPFEAQNVHFEVINVKSDSRGKLKETVMGSAKISLQPIISLDRNSLIQLKILDDEEALVGKLSFGHCKVRPILSFLDYKINLNLDFIPIIVIDFSLSNILDGGKNKSMHDLNPQESNDYISVINHIRHVYKDISQFCMGFGIGAKTCPSQIHSSDVFALSGNIIDPTIPYNKVIQCYKSTSKRVKPSSPINFKPVLQSASAYAKHEFERHKGRNYFCLFYITPGVIDDADEFTDFIREIADLPISVTVIQIKNPSFREMDDLAVLQTSFSGSQGGDKRQMMFCMEYRRRQEGKERSLLDTEGVFAKAELQRRYRDDGKTNIIYSDFRSGVFEGI